MNAFNTKTGKNHLKALINFFCLIKIEELVLSIWQIDENP